jgi:hypothetical protein
LVTGRRISSMTLLLCLSQSRRSVCIGDVFGLFRADVWGSAGFAPGGAIDRLAIVIRKRLNDRQRAVLAWIGAGCPEGVMAGSSYKTTAVRIHEEGLPARGQFNRTNRPGTAGSGPR